MTYELAYRYACEDARDDWWLFCIERTTAEVRAEADRYFRGAANSNDAEVRR